MKDLAVAQAGHDVILTWTNPPRYVDGSAATNLARIQIQANGAALSTVKVEAAGRAQSLAIPVSPATAGERIFTVIVETAQGKLSQVSNAASITAVDVPGRITNLSANADQRRIVLRWDKPLDHPELADAYIVMRTDAPTESETVTETRYEDIRYQAGKEFTYQLTPVRRVAGRVIPGVGPEIIRVMAQDKTPPMVPTGLAMNPSDSGAFLTWDANSETDLAGYRVFRSDRADAAFKPVGERLITTNVFFDTSYRTGFYYAVSAVDEFGNESAMTPPFRGP